MNHQLARLVLNTLKPTGTVSNTRKHNWHNGGRIHRWKTLGTRWYANATIAVYVWRYPLATLTLPPSPQLIRNIQHGIIYKPDDMHVLAFWDTLCSISLMTSFCYTNSSPSLWHCHTQTPHYDSMIKWDKQSSFLKKIWTMFNITNQKART